MSYKRFKFIGFFISYGRLIIMNLGFILLLYFGFYLAYTSSFTLSNNREDWKTPLEFLGLLFTPYIAILGSFFLWRQILREEEATRLETYMELLDQHYQNLEVLLLPKHEDEVWEGKNFEFYVTQELRKYLDFVETHNRFPFPIHQMKASIKQNKLDQLIDNYIFSTGLVYTIVDTHVFTFFEGTSESFKEIIREYFRYNKYILPGITDVNT